MYSYFVIQIGQLQPCSFIGYLKAVSLRCHSLKQALSMTHSLGLSKHVQLLEAISIKARWVLILLNIQ